MSSVSRRPLGPAVDVRGVFPADPYNPPVPPAGWVAREIRDQWGAMQAWTMYPAAHDNETALAKLYDHLDVIDPTYPRPRLTP